jgi:hypothetical protein
MPIFHDPHDSPPTPSFLPQASSTRPQRAGTQGLAYERKTVDDLRPEASGDSEMSFDRDSESPSQARKPSVFGRKELIERIKRTNSPAWLQRQGVSVGGLLESQIIAPCSHAEPDNVPQSDSTGNRSTSTRPTSRDRPKTPVLPSSGQQTSRTSTPEHLRDPAAAGLEIERPRSALHSGDFRRRGQPRLLGMALQFLNCWRLRRWSRGIAPSQLLATRLIEPMLHMLCRSVMTLTRLREHGQYHSHHSARLRFYLLQAHWYTRQTTQI